MVKNLTADNERLSRELTNSQLELGATKTDMAQQQEDGQQALESLTKKCLAFEEELSKFTLLQPTTGSKLDLECSIPLQCVQPWV